MSMDILERIVADKRIEVASKKKVLPLEYLKNAPLIGRTSYSLSDSLRQGSGIIAEFKRRSPSRQVINHTSPVNEVVQAYESAGASGVSVLTDTQYFGGALDDLLKARSILTLPLLRKEFIIDPYQVVEAKAFGADAILLIAAILSPENAASLSVLANDLGMEVLLEVHDEEELYRSELSHVDMIGVNNRNLKTFEVDLETSRRISALIPEEKISVSESGISNPGAILELRNFGYRGFLIGENFMKTDDPGKAAREFLKRLKDEA
jgi:indole-3-glycerol phosphate synthase